MLQVVRLGMFEVHCDELIRGLAKRAEGIANKLLTRMSKDHQEANKAYVILRTPRYAADSTFKLLYESYNSLPSRLSQHAIVMLCVTIRYIM